MWKWVCLQQSEKVTAHITAFSGCDIGPKQLLFHPKSRQPVSKEDWDFCSHICNRIFLASNCAVNLVEILSTYGHL